MMMVIYKKNVNAIQNMKKCLSFTNFEHFLATRIPPKMAHPTTAAPAPAPTPMVAVLDEP